MATTADIKIGMCIELDGKTFQIVDFQHVKPGKEIGRASCRERV